MTEPAQNLKSNVIDLATVGRPEGLGAILAHPEQPFKVKSYDPAPARENVRGQIALWLIWTLVGVVVLAAVAAILVTARCIEDNSCTTQAIELGPLRVLIGLVLTPLVGLVGAVTGFYFGENSAAGRNDEG